MPYLKESNRVIREIWAFVALILGVLCTCVALGYWNRMNEVLHIFCMCFVPVALIGSIVLWRLSIPKANKRRQHSKENYDTEHRNPPAQLPPLR